MSIGNSKNLHTNLHKSLTQYQITASPDSRLHFGRHLSSERVRYHNSDRPDDNVCSSAPYDNGVFSCHCLLCPRLYHGGGRCNVCAYSRHIFVWKLCADLFYKLKCTYSAPFTDHYRCFSFNCRKMFSLAQGDLSDLRDYKMRRNRERSAC